MRGPAGVQGVGEDGRGAERGNGVPCAGWTICAPRDPRTGPAPRCTWKPPRAFQQGGEAPPVLSVIALTSESSLGFPAAPSGKDREFPHVPAPTRTASPLSPSPPENVPRASPSVSLH